MKKKIEFVISLFIVGIMVIAGMCFLSNLTERKASRNKFEDFYSSRENYDVLFVGSSHVLNGILPMELWREYGMVSYNLAGHGNRLATSYWVLKNALEYTTPKLVVVDCCMVGKEEKVGSVEQLHISVDWIPYGSTKKEMLDDLLEDSAKKTDFLWKFSTYHNRWNELKKEDFGDNCSVEKGAESRIAVAVPEDTLDLGREVKLEQETLGTEYLRRMIEECQEGGIEVLLTYLPFPDNSGWQIESNTVADIAAEYDVAFLDYHTLADQVNFQTDCYDKDSHLNPSGAKKITKYVGQYIVEHYDVIDWREEKKYQEWEEDYQHYKEFKWEQIRREEELKNYLMLLQDSDVSVGFYFRQDGELEKNPVVLELLSNAWVDYASIPKEESCFVFLDQKTAQQSIIKPDETLENSFGTFSLFYNENAQLEFNHNGINAMQVTFDDIALMVFDNNSLEFVDQAKFKLKDANVQVMRDKEE